MSRGFDQKGTGGITRHYDRNGNMTGFSQRGGDGVTRNYDNNGNIRGFSHSNGYGGRIIMTSAEERRIVLGGKKMK